ncbi:MAG: NACHT domain-containing protein [Prochloraceae cyanobacterium]
MSKNGFLEGRQRLLVIIFALFIFAIHLSYFMGGLPLALLTSLATFFLLWISQLVWSSPDYGKFRISLAIFSLVGFISLTILQRGHWLVCLLRILKQSELTWAIKIENFLNCFTTPITTHFSLNALVLIFNLLSIYLVLKFLWSDRTMQKNSNSLDRDFEEQSYIEWLKCFRGVLQKNSGYSNDRTFSKTHFIDLQAEIETTKSGLKLKKRVALIPFIKSELENKNILLLGDSGAGKSLTLSQLEERLIKNKNDISLTPIYINCKYWTESKEWVQQGKEPTVDDLKKFIDKSLYRFNGADSKNVLDQDYRKIMERKGKFLFLLDSFDEIPAILELERSDELVKKLWKVIETFVEDHKSRYIVASRFKPESELQSDSDRSIFEILPFSDIQIEKALNESLKYNKDETIKELFTNRSELIPIARNPFMMALLCQYAATEDKNRLPDRQIELYENHFTTRLKSKQCQKKIKKLNLELSVTQIIDKCVDIAWLMFKNNYGLEISVSDLKKELQIISQNKKTNNIIEVLKIAGLIRFGGADKETFSFVHRRFNDYLVVKYLFANPKEVIPDNILNPKWRDILILYYDLVASENPQEAKKIANFCWQKIKNAQESCCDKNDNNKLDALNSIRFLASAFKSKPKYIESIRPDIFKFIEQQVTEKNNIFFAKNSIEAVGILTNEQIDRICLIGLETNNDLISKTAIRYCRHLPKTSKQLQLAIIDYLESILFLEFIRRIQEILFDFKLADGFQRIKRYCCFRILDSSILILFIFLKILFHTPGFTLVFSSAIKV